MNILDLIKDDDINESKREVVFEKAEVFFYFIFNIFI